MDETTPSRRSGMIGLGLGLAAALPLAATAAPAKPAKPGAPAKGTQGSGTFTTKAGTLMYYKDWGTGQPIVFHHGWPLSADEWDKQMLYFMAQGYRVVAFDRRGDGRSSQNADRIDMDTFAADTADLVAHLNLSNAIHVGHSTGGGVVARYVARYGRGKVAKAVLLAAVTPLCSRPTRTPAASPCPCSTASASKSPPTEPSSTSTLPSWSCTARTTGWFPSPTRHSSRSSSQARYAQDLPRLLPRHGHRQRRRHQPRPSRLLQELTSAAPSPSGKEPGKGWFNKSENA